MNNQQRFEQWEADLVARMNSPRRKQTEISRDEFAAEVGEEIGEKLAECSTCGGTKILISRTGELIDCPKCGSTDIRDARMRKVAKLSSINGRSARQTFENFDVDGSAVLGVARKWAEQWVQGGEGWHPWLVLHGSPGAGQSHLASAAANALLAAGKMVVYMTAPEMLISLRATFGKADGDSFEESLSRDLGSDWLILDDWGTEKVSEWASEVWFTIFNSRYRNEKPTMVTSNLNLSRGGGSGVDERLIDRLNEDGFSRVFEVKAKSWRAKK